MVLGDFNDNIVNIDDPIRVTKKILPSYTSQSISICDRPLNPSFTVGNRFFNDNNNNMIVEVMATGIRIVYNNVFYTVTWILLPVSRFMKYYFRKDERIIFTYQTNAYICDVNSQYIRSRLTIRANSNRPQHVVCMIL